MLTCTKCNQSKDESEFYRNERYASGYMTWCKKCLRDYYKEPDHKSKLYAVNKRWADTHKDKVKQDSHDWFEQNKERLHELHNARSRERWATDPEHRERKNQQKKESVKRRKSDPDFQEKLREWARRATTKYEHRKKNLPVTLSVDEWNQILKEHNNSCAYCGVPQSKLKYRLQQEHKIPVSRGGGYTCENIVPACVRCNRQKATKTDIEFREWLAEHPQFLKYRR